MTENAKFKPYMSCSCFVTGIQNLEEVAVFHMTQPVDVARFLSPRSEFGLICKLMKIALFSRL